MESTTSNLDPAWLARTLDEKLINCSCQPCIHTSLPSLSSQSQSQVVGNSSSSSSGEMGCRKRIKEDGDEKRNKEKKRRMEWTPELHAKFEQAVHHLGVDTCGPKKILEIMETMGVAYLTREQVASHLQKYRLSVARQQRENEEKAAAAAAAAATAIRFPPRSMNLHHHDNNMAIPDDLSRRRSMPVQMPTAAHHHPPHISDTPSLLPPPPCLPPRFKQFDQGFYNIPHSMPTPHHSIFRPREENHIHNNRSGPLPVGHSYSGRINQNQQQQGYSYSCHAFVDSILRNNDDEDEDPSRISNM